nr:DNA-processing protein DprA [Sediminibacillus albus]
MRKILNEDPQLEQVFNYSILDLKQNFSLSENRARSLYSDLHSSHVFHQLQADLSNFQAVTIFDSAYPPLLRSIKDCPLVLYFIGEIGLVRHFPSLSIVGTRTPSKEACYKMNKIIPPLISEGWLIVSGMAKGIDGFAHQLAIEGSGKTIAVLGGGFRHIYPKDHRGLFHTMAASQLLLSEYPPNSPPQRYYFPERNRLISGLSFGTLVVEAKEKSGTLITVDQALDQGREVYAIPGSPLSPEAAGCNKMIQEGAKLVQNTYDLLEDWQYASSKWSRFLSEKREIAFDFLNDLQ